MTPALLLLAGLALQQPAAPYDVIISGGTVVDGSGAARFRADVAIRGDQIVRVSRTPLPAASARRVIEARGRVVAPGFIDLHAHLDPLLRLPGAENAVRQGITTSLGGPDGSAPWPLGRYLDSARALGVGMNVAFLVGHNTIRRAVLGMADRAPTAPELERMRTMVAQAMTEGALGLSTGCCTSPALTRAPMRSWPWPRSPPIRAGSTRPTCGPKAWASSKGSRRRWRSAAAPASPSS